MTENEKPAQSGVESDGMSDSDVYRTNLHAMYGCCDGDGVVLLRGEEAHCAFDKNIAALIAAAVKGMHARGCICCAPICYTHEGVTHIVDNLCLAARQEAADGK